MKKTHFIWIILIVILFTVKGSDKQVQAEPKKLKIAVCQIFCLDGDRKGNFARIEHALKEAKTSGADIACFPEMAILGWVNPDAHSRAYAIPGRDSDRIQELARKYDTFIAIGLAEKVGSDLYDSVILVDNTGQILLKHRKINILTELMTPPYTPGTEVNAVDTKFGKIGLLICADTFMEKNRAAMAALQPDLLLVSYGWAAKEEEWPEHGKALHDVVCKTALQVKAPVVGTDLVGQISKGPWKDQTYGGQSVVVDKKGRILAIANDRDREVRIVELFVNPEE